MRTDLPPGTPSSSSVLFLFAHQDDEIGVLHQIEMEVKSGASVYCAYTTSGVVSGANPQRRNAESRHVLESLGIDPKQIFFQGEKLNVPDGQALVNIAKLYAWLDTWTKHHQPLRTIYAPAWEGGHPDHDVLHAVTVHIQSSRSETILWQYPLYNSNGLRWGFFKVLTPLVMNGDVLRQCIPWSARWRHLRLCLSYRSQAKSWLGLYPFVLWHYIFKGWQSLQLASLNRLQQRPHPGQLYYEFRGSTDWQKVFSRLRQEACLATPKGPEPN
jgi:LmbE family N-acetylglucosaminyl deacetylase